MIEPKFVLDLKLTEIQGKLLLANMLTKRRLKSIADNKMTVKKSQPMFNNEALHRELMKTHRRIVTFDNASKPDTNRQEASGSPEIKR
jgi:hypothetical protein